MLTIWELCILNHPEYYLHFINAETGNSNEGLGGARLEFPSSQLLLISQIPQNKGLSKLIKCKTSANIVLKNRACHAAKQVQQCKTYVLWGIVDDEDSGTKIYPQILWVTIWAQPNCMCVWIKQCLIHAVERNQTLFIKLGNKRNVLGCLTEIKLRKTSSNILEYGLAKKVNMFYKTLLDDVLWRCFTCLDRP